MQSARWGIAWSASSSTTGSVGTTTRRYGTRDGAWGIWTGGATAPSSRHAPCLPPVASPLRGCHGLDGLAPHLLVATAGAREQISRPHVDQRHVQGHTCLAAAACNE